MSLALAHRRGTSAFTLNIELPEDQSPTSTQSFGVLDAGPIRSVQVMAKNSRYSWASPSTLDHLVNQRQLDSDDAYPRRRTLTPKILSVDPTAQFSEVTAPLRHSFERYLKALYDTNFETEKPIQAYIKTVYTDSEIYRRLSDLKEMVSEEGGELNNISVAAFSYFWQSAQPTSKPSIVATDEGHIVAAWHHSNNRLLRLEFIHNDLVRYTAFTPSLNAPGGSRKEAGLLTTQELLEDKQLIALTLP